MGPRSAETTEPRANILSGIRLHAGLVFLSALAFLIRGYAFGAEDQNLFLPFVYHWNDLSCFPHDYLLGLTFAKGSLTWPAVTLLSRFLPLEPLLLTFYLAALYATLLLTFKTALLVSEDRAAAWLAVCLWLPLYPVPGAGIPTFDGYFTASTLGLVAATLALYLFLKGRSGGACAALAAGALVHVLSVLPVSAGVGLSWFRNRRWSWLALLAASLAAPAALLVLLGAGGGSGHELFSIYRGEWFEFLWRKLPDSFPQAWAGRTWLEIASYLVAWGVSAWQLSREDGHGARERLNWAVAGALLLFPLGLLGAAYRVAILVQLSLFRASLWVIYALTLLAAWWIADLARNGDLRLRLLAVFLATSWLYGSADVHAAVMVALVAQRRSLFSLPTAKRFWGIASIGASLAILLVQASAFFERPEGRGLREQEALVGVALAAGLFLVVAAAPAAWRARASFPSTAWVALVVLLLLPSEHMVREGIYLRALTALVPRVAMDAAKEQTRRGAESTMGEMEARIRSQVPADATVIVSPRWMRFRAQTMRSSFVTFKDRCGMLYSRTFATEWIARMRALHAYRPGDWTMDDSLDLSREELLRLAAAYAGIRLEYIVTARDYSFPLLGTSGALKLYRIQGDLPAAVPGEGKDAPTGQKVH